MATYTGLEIAVIGMSGRFPQAGNTGEFWENIRHGRESVEFLSREELVASGVPENVIDSKDYIGIRNTLKEKVFFDAAFFDIRPVEAAVMDPQTRVFHECVWEALESAGYNPFTCPDKIGLFAGASSNILWEINTIANKNNYVDDFSASFLRDARFLPSRIAYAFNLRGPVVYVHSACSTSLLAVYQACNSLLLGECNIALAGGVSIPGETRLGYTHEEGMILSADGHCRTFDIAASGTIGGEGAGVVVLKKLEDALRDNDTVLAIIKGGGINNDGREKVGYTAPSVDGQAKAILMALQMADITPESVGYIEAHGTATRLGDVIEIEALKRAYGTREQHRCALGAVKANIGHLDAAAGIAGFIKTVLAIKNRELPPAINYTTPNPELHLEDSAFYVNTELTSWDNHGFPLRAGVSSFGIGGTNVHIILEEAPVRPVEATEHHPQLLVVSGRTPAALENNLRSLYDFLSHHQDVSIADVSYTLQVGRRPFEYREALTVASVAEAVAVLEEKPDSLKPQRISRETLQKVFMFTGQGSQYSGMCSDLYKEEGFFREQVDRCLQIAARFSPLDLENILFPGPVPVNSAYTINDTICSQPALFIIEYALCQLIMKWGITPDFMIGHSIGEYVAACIAGVFSLEDALQLVIRRGELMQQTRPGTMLGVSVGPDTLQQLLTSRPRLSVASVNSPAAFVVSGTLEAIQEFATTLELEGITFQRLQVSHAFHSALMDEVLADFEAAVQQVTIHPPLIRYISTFTGNEADYTLLRQPSYWANQLRHTVKFADGIGTLLQLKQVAFIEVGAGNVLCSFVQHHPLYAQQHTTCCLVPHPREKTGGRRFLLNRIGGLWKAGIVPSWENMYGPQTAGRIPLPTYSFEKVKYPVKVELDKILAGQGLSGKKEGKSDMASWFYAPVWEQQPIHFLPGYNKKERKDTCIFFTSDHPLCAELKDCLQKAGTRVLQVRPGKQFDKAGEDTYVIDPEDPDDYIRLLEDMQDNTLRADSILHAWQLTTGAFHELTTEVVTASQATGLYSLLYMAQAIGIRQISYQVQIDVLTNHLHEVMGGELRQPEKATMLGAVKVIPLEYSNISCRNIDIETPATANRETPGLTQKLLEELQLPVADILVAYRGDMRWIQSFRQVTLHEGPSDTACLKKNGVYVITGAMGGMGFSIAEYLATEYSATLALVGRSDFPSRTQWATWKEIHGEEDEISKKIGRLQAMEAKGAVIYTYTADVSDAAAMKAVVSNVIATCGSMNGVIHTAGVIDFGGIIQRRNKASVDSVMAPKLQGPVIMYELVKELPLDFFIVFSSIGNVLYGGKFGQIGYNASNEFLDAFAVYLRRHAPFYTTSVNWCDWQEVGMSVKAIHHQREDEEALKDKLSRLKQTAITPAEGVSVFEKIIRSGVPRIAISPTDLADDLRRMQAYLSHRSQYLEEILLSDNTDVKVARPTLTADYVLPQSEMEIQLAGIWGNFFGFDKIGARDNFFELGGDSLKALKLLAMMKQDIQRDIPLAGLFEMPTIQELAVYLEQEQVVQEKMPLVAAEKRIYYELASTQKRVLFLHEMDKTSLAYNMPNAVLLKGALDRQRIEDTFNAVIRQHESLRTFFVIHQHEYVQRIAHDVAFEVEYYTCEGEEELHTVIAHFIQPFDIGKAPLFRACIIALKPEEHLLVVDAHHVIFDGMSQSVLINDFMAVYSGKALKAPEFRFTDYTTWQYKYERSKDMEVKRQFWHTEFAHPVPVIDLPADYKRPAVKSYEGAVYTCTMDEQVTRAIRELAANEGVTVFAFLFAVYNILLARLSNLEDIVAGTATSGRMHKEMQHVIGMFVNTMPMRNAPAGNLSFTAFLQNVKRKMTAFFKHQDYSYEHLLREFNIRNDGVRNPFFDTIFNYSKGADNALEIPGLKIEPFNISSGISKMDLILTVMESDRNLHFSYEYYSKLFRPETVARMAGYFDRIVSAVLHNRDIRIADIELLQPVEKAALLERFSPQISDEHIFPDVLQQFESMVAHYPHNIAAIAEDTAFTYLQLSEQVRSMTDYLLYKGVKQGDVIGLSCQDGLTFFSALMAILKAGAIAMPLAAGDNITYLTGCCEAAGVSMMITDRKAALFLPAGVLAVFPDEVLPEMGRYMVYPEVRPEDTAWITFRYNEQHLLVPHHQQHGELARTLDLLHRTYPVKAGDTVLQQHTMELPLLRYEQYWNILSGATVLFENIDTVTGLIQQAGITQLQLNNRQLTTLLTEHDTWYKGERATGTLRIFVKDDITGIQDLLPIYLPHMPGISCSFIYGYPDRNGEAIFHDITIDDQRVYSTPVSKLQLAVLDQYNNLQATEQEGELGWLEDGHDGSAGIYKTGEQVKWFADGRLTFLSTRRDICIIDGQTICLPEIDHRLSGLEGISDAAVFYMEGDTPPYLCALLLCDPSTDLQQVHEQLKYLLPACMLPSRYVITDALPDKRNVADLSAYINAHQLSTLRITAVSCDSDLSVSEQSLMENEMNF